MEKINNIVDAIKILKRGQALSFYTNGKKNIIFYKNNIFKIFNDNSKISLNEDELKELYFNMSFYTMNDEDTNDIDIKKDAEYYSYSALKH